MVFEFICWILKTSDKTVKCGTTIQTYGLKLEVQNAYEKFTLVCFASLLKPELKKDEI